MDVSILPEVSKDAKLKVWFSQTLEVCDLTNRLAPKWCFAVETKWSPGLCIGGSQDWSLEPGNTKGEVSLYHWPPVWLVWMQLYDNRHFCFYLQNRLIQTNQTGGQWYSDTSPFSIPCLSHKTKWSKKWRGCEIWSWYSLLFARLPNEKTSYRIDINCQGKEGDIAMQYPLRFWQQTSPMYTSI